LQSLSILFGWRKPLKKAIEAGRSPRNRVGRKIDRGRRD
jgi:hypothetical protein